ncbi:TPA: LPD38 domain-containing protein [Photobacterium damselae]
MSDQLLGDGFAPKATVNAKTDMNTFSKQDLGNSGLPIEPNYEVGISDIGKSTLSAGLRSISGIAEIGNQNVKALENKANKDDGFVSDIANAMTYVPIIPIADKVLPKLRDGLSSIANSIDSTLSPDAKKAAQTMPVTKEGDEWRFSSDPAVFGMNFANVVGYMLPTVATAFATRGQSLAALEPALTRAMIRTGASKAVAEKALPYVVNTLKSAPATAVGITSDLGSQGNDIRRQALDTNFEQLSESKYFREAFSDIDRNPETASLTDGQKLSLARERVADFVSRATISDPMNIAASAVATMLGDVPLANAALKGLKTTPSGLRGAVHGFISGGLREAPLEGIQEGIQQKVSNNVSNQYLGSDIDPNQGVDIAQANGALLGFLSGGSLNAIGGLRGEHEQTIEPETQTDDFSSNKVDVEPETTLVDVSTSRDLNEDPQATPTHAQHGYTKEEAIDDLNAPAYLREELRNQVGPQSDPNTEPSYDVDDLSIPAYLRNRKEINEALETHKLVSEPNTKEQSFSLKEGTVKPKTFDDPYQLADEHHINGKNDASDVSPNIIYGHDQSSKILAQNNDDKYVDSDLDGGLKKSQRRELEYLAKRRADKIPLAMQNLKGAVRITRPEYREGLVQLVNQSSALSHNKEINHQLDTVTSAITKLGGINRDLAKSEGIDEAHFKRNQLFPAKGGRTFDEMAEVLNEHGFTARSGKSLSANDVLDLVGGKLDNNERHYSNQSDAILETDKGSALAELVREYGNEKIQIAIKKALKGEQLDPRQAGLVNAAMDAIEISLIEQSNHVLASSVDSIEEGKVDNERTILWSQESFTSETDKPFQGMPLKQAKLAVQSWLRQYKGGAGVSVKVVQTQVEAEQILGTKLDGYKINAFYDEVSASVVVVADNIANTKELRKKLRHEILVHHGLRAVVGDTEYGRILKTIYSGLESKHIKMLIKDVEKNYNRSDLNSFVEEVLAYVSEVERNTIQQWYDRIVSVIAQALRKVGLMSQSDITKAELHNIVQTLTERIKSVNEWGPGTEPPKESGNGRLSRTKFSKAKAADGLFDRDTFLAAVDKARKIAQGTSKKSAAGFDIPAENLKSKAIRNLADKFHVLKELQKNITQAGGKVDESNDAYLAEELFHGKSENDLRLMKEKYIQPLADKMAKFNINQAKLDEYLIARHAQERNGYIAKINPKFPDGGSGITNSDAAAKLDEIRRSGKQKQYDELAYIIDAMISEQRDVIKASGLESDDLVDTWQSHYKYYVPLKGTAKDEPSSARTGKGFSIGGKESKTAKGRQSMAESPSSHAIIDLTEKLIRAQKNEVGNTLLKLVQDNPSPDYWQVFTNEHPDTVPDIVERKNAVTGEKERTVIDRAVPMAMMSDYYFPTKKDGKVYYIKLHDSRLMNAMKNMGPDTSNGVIRTMAKVNRFLATVNTSYNPEFVVGNFARDIQTAFLNLSAEQTRDDGKIKGQKVAKQTIKDIPQAMRAVYASLRDKSLNSAHGKNWQSYFEDFMFDGGKTGWFDMKDVDSQAKELDRLVAMASDTIKGRAYKLLSSTTGFIENLNGAVENAVRLSAYVNAREAGVSRKKAASLAKNMTVNFNRRGEVGTTLNAMYMFANASVQGSVNFMRTMYGLNGDGKLKWKNLNQAQKIAMGIVAGSFALSFANRNSAGNDEDGQNWFDKVPNYVKERNFIIMKSLLGGEQDGSYWSIPMPYGYNIFALLGSGFESAANSDYLTKAQIAGNIALAALSSFSPIGLSESNTVTGTILKNAAPTIAKPFLDVGLNENFYGGQVYKENMPFGVPLPESSLSKIGTSEHYKHIATWLNRATGGSEFRSGGIDVSPDVLQYMVGYLGGAALRFASVKVPGLIDRLGSEDVEPSQVAFLSRISGRVMPYEDQQKFYQRRVELMQIADEANSLSGAKRQKFVEQYKKQLRSIPLLKSTDKKLRLLRMQRNHIYGLDIPQKDKDLRIKNIERKMKLLIDQFNKKNR